MIIALANFSKKHKALVKWTNLGSLLAQLPRSVSDNARAFADRKALNDEM